MAILTTGDISWAEFDNAERRRAEALMLAVMLFPQIEVETAHKVARYIRTGRWSCDES